MKVIDKNTGKIYNSIAQACRECEWIKCHKRTLQKHIKRDGCFNSIYPYISGNMETESTVTKNAPVHRIHEVYTEEELDKLVELKEKQKEVEVFKIVPKEANSSKRVAISLLSDIHIDEKIEKASVMNLNYYDEKVAKIRLLNYFERLVKMMKRNPAPELIIGILGDIIGNYLHPELAQTNTMSPGEAIQYAKSCIISGLEHLLENIDVDNITVVCVCGNHGRTQPKKQYSNFHKLNYEYFLYLEISQYFKDNAKIKFIIPESELCITTVLGKKILWHHGDSVRTGGSGVTGIFPGVMRYYHKMNSVFKVDLCCLGHYHTLNFMDKVITNGSCVGYSAFAMSHGFPFEEPAQAFFVIDEKHGYRVYAPIYLK